MKKFIILGLILQVTIFSYSQGHFTKIWSGSGTDQMTIYAIKGTIDGINLQAGDEIAVFDNTDCVGVTILTGVLDDNNYNSMVTIICSSTDPGIKNGFTPGHSIGFKLWDVSQNKEITIITPEFFDIQMNSVPAPKFTSNESAFVKLSVVNSSTNQIPVANAGIDQSLEEGALVTLDGSSSTDSDNDPLTYLWSAPVGITLSSTTAAKPSFTAPEVTFSTNYTFSLTVNDGTSDSPADQVVINVINVDHTPYVKEKIPNVSVDKRSADKIIELAAVFADNDYGDILSYSINSNTNNQVVTAGINGSTLTLSFSSEITGKSEITITASSNEKSVQLTFEVEVKTPTVVGPSLNEPEIQIYPIPTKGNVYLNFGNTPPIDTWVIIYNTAGNVVQKFPASKTIETINFNGYAEDIYFIKINPLTSKTYKVRVER